MNLKANKAAFHNLYENTWTIAIFAFLIAGISGMVVWILVRVPGGGGGNSNIKKVGVLVVSLKGVNFRFWSRLGC